jgi:hypothetical protein
MFAMDRRRAPAIVLAALALHLIAPFAAYAAMKPAPGFNDICSASAKMVSTGGAPATAPRSGLLDHKLAHCAFCPAGAAAAAVSPKGSASLLLVRTGHLRVPAVHSAAPAAAPVLCPPPRGPPEGPASI